MRRSAIAIANALLIAGCASAGTGGAGGSEASHATTIVNATLLDGTGAARRAASVRIVGDRIVAVGAVSPAAGDEVIEARGLALAPGFIDTHSHADRGLSADPGALAALSQGITTIIGGQDGGSPYPLSEFLARREGEPAAVNIASYAGHGTIRRVVMKDDFRRTARREELDSMRALLRREMDAGALGLSTGLEYDPGIYSDRSEVLELAKVAGASGGRYISHIRSEDRDFWSAIDEIIAIGREARIPVQISHAKLAMRSLWGQANRLIELLDSARAQGVDVTADIYPYTYWQSTLTVLFPQRNFEDRKAAEFALTEVSTPAGLLLGRYDPQPTYAGKTVAEIARLRGTDSVTTLIELVRAADSLEKRTGRGVESVIGTSMVEADIERIMRWSYANLCTDGELNGRHPRGFGAFPRFLGRYVRERSVVSLEEAVRKMTSLAAANVGIQNRGTVVPGRFADLVLFDPTAIIDHSTPSAPHSVASGISRVWVNGVVVFEGGKGTGKRPGVVIRRGAR